MQLDIDFSDKHIVLFGGTTAINFGMAQAFARHGSNDSVMSCSQINVDPTCAQLAQVGGQVFGTIADVMDYSAAKADVDQLIRVLILDWGSQSICINSISPGSNKLIAPAEADRISGTLMPCDGGGAFDCVKPAIEAAGRRTVAASHA